MRRNLKVVNCKLNYDDDEKHEKFNFFQIKKNMKHSKLNN